MQAKYHSLPNFVHNTNGTGVCNWCGSVTVDPLLKVHGPICLFIVKST